MWFLAWQQLSGRPAERGSKQLLGFLTGYNRAGVRILVIFQDWPIQPYHSKGRGESFPLMWLNMGLC